MPQGARNSLGARRFHIHVLGCSAGNYSSFVFLFLAPGDLYHPERLSLPRFLVGRHLVTVESRVSCRRDFRHSRRAVYLAFGYLASGRDDGFGQRPPPLLDLLLESVMPSG